MTAKPPDQYPPSSWHPEAQGRPDVVGQKLGNEVDANIPAETFVGSGCHEISQVEGLPQFIDRV